MFRVDRRTVLGSSLAGAAVSLLPAWPSFAQNAARTYGLSYFGDLKYGPDFQHFDYANLDAPKGGRIVTQIWAWAYNQNPNTFNTLNIYVLQGDGAAGVPLTFATLMAGSADESDSLYPYLAREIETPEDRGWIRFFLDDRARFHDGAPVTAEDAAFSIETLKRDGHPNIATELAAVTEVLVENPLTLLVRFAPGTPRSLALTVAGSIPVFSKAWWEGRDFKAALSEAPLGSGLYKVGNLSFGRWIEFERVADHWAKELPAMRGRYNFDVIRYEYYRDRTAAFEAFKKGEMNVRQESTSRIWARDYNFPALTRGEVRKEELPDGSPAGGQGWYFNTRRPKFADVRVREALVSAFDFEWTNANIMFNSYRRTSSIFENSILKAEGLPSEAELKLLEPHRGKLPASVFAEPFVPPVSDGTGRDRTLIRRASELLAEAGCTRSGSQLLLPDGSPFTIEFLDDDDAFEPHHNAYIRNLGLLGIAATYRVVDPAQYQSRLDAFDFDMLVSRFSMSLYPSDGLRQFFDSSRADQNGSYNLAGIKDPVVDALLSDVIGAGTREEFVTASKALDRVLR
ncbi:MAG: ABC transporter substrate-binding protein, partial [Rhizobiales bacterium]|nr:ABC transporter substrate-binding protein [Hyphomicrobiales bacterium]